jgi:diphthamide synthase subunit DPH2
MSSIAENYEASRTAAYIARGGYKRVALQFPDELLGDAPLVLSAVRARLPEALEEVARASTSPPSSSPPVRLVVLGDTSYGSCCVDEVAAAHANADLIVHYGHACLSAPSTTPVLYVFGRRGTGDGDGSSPSSSSSGGGAVVARTLVYEVRKAAGDAEARVLFLWDPDLTHDVPSVLDAVAREIGGVGGGGDVVWSSAPDVGDGERIAFASPHPALIVPPLRTAYGKGGAATAAAAAAAAAEGSEGGGDASSSSPSSPPQPLSVCGFAVAFPGATRDAPVPPPEALRIVYWGDKSQRSRLLAVQFAGSLITRVEPSPSPSPAPATEDVGSGSGRAMARRYRMVEVVKAAGALGIVMGTLAVDRHREITARLRALCAASGKGCYTFLLGKLNPAKLGNFPEIDAFVLIACPESTLLSDEVAASHLKPVVTPHEVLIALADYEEDAIADDNNDDDARGGAMGGAAAPEAARSWTGRGLVDFSSLLPAPGRGRMCAEPSSSSSSCCCGGGTEGGSCACGPGGGGEEVDGEEEAGDESDDDAPVFSLITGGMVGGGGRPRRRGGKRRGEVGAATTPAAAAASSSTDIVAHAISSSTSSNALANVPGVGYAGSYLIAKREWRGLSYEVGGGVLGGEGEMEGEGGKSSTRIHQGMVGIASGYSGEKEGRQPAAAAGDEGRG